MLDVYRWGPASETATFHVDRPVVIDKQDYQKREAYSTAASP